MIPLQLVVGPPEHGVVRYARELATTVRQLSADAKMTECDLPALVRSLAGTGTPVPRHLHVTDRLLGRHPEHAADLIEALARRAPLSVTLHDLPQPSDGLASLPRRAAAYRRMVAAAHGVAVNSAHEAALLRDFVRPKSASALAIIPLPVASPTPATVPPIVIDAFVPEVAIIGFVYPGKGHREAIAAVASQDRSGRAAGPTAMPGLGVTALGTASAGHEADVGVLADYAQRLKTRFTVTGYLHDAELFRRSREVAVPLAAHRHVSASGSVAWWLAAGRRPLVPNTRYFREMLALRPRTLTLYEPDAAGLASAIGSALRHPLDTVLSAEISTAPHLPETAAAYLRWWQTGVRW